MKGKKDVCSLDLIPLSGQSVVRERERLRGKGWMKNVCLFLPTSQQTGNEFSLSLVNFDGEGEEVFFSVCCVRETHTHQNLFPTSLIAFRTHARSQVTTTTAEREGGVSPFTCLTDKLLKRENGRMDCPGNTTTDTSATVESQKSKVYERFSHRFSSSSFSSFCFFVLFLPFPDFPQIQPDQVSPRAVCDASSRFDDDDNDGDHVSICLSTWRYVNTLSFLFLVSITDSMSWVDVSRSLSMKVDDGTRVQSCLNVNEREESPSERLESSHSSYWFEREPSFSFDNNRIPHFSSHRLHFLHQFISASLILAWNLTREERFRRVSSFFTSSHTSTFNSAIFTSLRVCPSPYSHRSFTCSNFYARHMFLVVFVCK